MRKISIIFLLWSTHLLGQANLPEAIRNYMDKHYPTAVYLESIGFEDQYIVKFEADGLAYKVKFNQLHEWLSTIHVATEQSLPKIIFDTLDKTYHHYKINEVNKVYTKSNNYYEVLVETDSDLYQLNFDLEGIRIK